MTGASAEAFGAAIVTDARRSVGLPHEGQNFFELSLQILIPPQKISAIVA